MLRLYIKIWDWDLIFGRAVKDIPHRLSVVCARIEAHYSIHRSKNGLPFFLSSIPSSFRTQEKLGEPLEAWEHIAGNTYYCWAAWAALLL